MEEEKEYYVSWGGTFFASTPEEAAEQARDYWKMEDRITVKVEQLLPITSTAPQTADYIPTFA